MIFGIVVGGVYAAWVTTKIVLMVVKCRSKQSISIYQKRSYTRCERFFCARKNLLEKLKNCKVVARFGVLIYSHSKGNKQQNERRTQQCTNL